MHRVAKGWAEPNHLNTSDRRARYQGMAGTSLVSKNTATTAGSEVSERGGAGHLEVSVAAGPLALLPAAAAGRLPPVHAPADPARHGAVGAGRPMEGRDCGTSGGSPATGRDGAGAA